MRTRTIRRLLPVAALTLAATTALAGCGGSSTSDSSTKAAAGNASAAASSDVQLVTAGQLKVCTNPPYNPFEIEGSDGQITGFDIDLTSLVAKQIGPNIKTVPVATPFETIESGAALDTGACDILASGITINDARKAKFDFSDPYFDVNLGVLTSDSSITDVASLKDKTVSAQIATTGLDWSKQQGLKVKEFKDLGLQVQALQTGDADASVGDLAVLTPYAKNGLKIAFQIPTGDQFGLGIKKGNTALLKAADQALAQAKADGTYAKLYKKYIGVDWTGDTTPAASAPATSAAAQ
ncbi:MAG: transporter substrate-binding domain-containing protein [Bifidobacteriaceae bacterium]|jgi:polar amino acid transport system substrate-binding protein|nr:transporter substrate-binding domain-containing protein [Bifidobacteriaceae bacterium]